MLIVITAQSPNVRRHAPLEPSESGEYPDDFDSSDDEREPADQKPAGTRKEDGEGDAEWEVPEECEVNSNSDEGRNITTAVFSVVLTTHSCRREVFSRFGRGTLLFSLDTH